MSQIDDAVLTEDNVRYIAAPLLLYMIGFAEMGDLKDNLKLLLPPNELESKPLKGRNDITYDQRVRNIVSHTNEEVIKRFFYMAIKGPKGTRIPSKFYLTDINGSAIRSAMIENKQDEWLTYIYSKGTPEATFIPLEKHVGFLKRFIVAGAPCIESSDGLVQVITCHDNAFAERMCSACGIHVLGWNQEGKPAAYIVKTEKEHTYGIYAANELALIKSRKKSGLCYVCIIKENEITGLITGLDIIDAVDM